MKEVCGIIERASNNQILTLDKKGTGFKNTKILYNIHKFLDATEISLQQEGLNKSKGFLMRCKNMLAIAYMTQPTIEIVAKKSYLSQLLGDKYNDFVDSKAISITTRTLCTR